MPRPPHCGQGNRQQTHLLTEVENNSSDIDLAYPLFNVTNTSTKPLLAPVEMEVDMGACVSLISKDTYDKQ